MYPLDDTIVAISSARGSSARGVVRLAGPAAVAIAAQIFESQDAPRLSDLSRPQCVAGRLTLQLSPDHLPRRAPCDLYVWPTTRSYTRQPVVELQTIGSPPLLEAVLDTLRRGGARLAQPGEFTLRAFLAGRIDLLQAEAVLGVIDAADRAKLDVALQQLAGGLTRPLADLRNRLLDLLADLEAGLDFAEEDIRFVDGNELDERLSAAAEIVGDLLAQMQTRALSSGLPRVVLLGSPNVGKSSLFNALVGNPAAIVSPIPGATRDYLSAEIECGDMKCQLLDTAGVEQRSASEALHDAAQQMTAEQRQSADLHVICLDATQRPSPSEMELLKTEERKLVVWTKCDAADTPVDVSPVAQLPQCRTSSVTGAGLDELRHLIAANLAPGVEELSGVVADTAVRCQDSLVSANDSLTRAREIARRCGPEELVAAELRLALTELGRIVGVIYTDDILDRVFSRFCIGK